MVYHALGHELIMSDMTLTLTSSVSMLLHSWDCTVQLRVPHFIYFHIHMYVFFAAYLYNCVSENCENTSVLEHRLKLS